MKLAWLLVVIIYCFCCCHMSNAEVAKDKRLTAISSTELLKSIASTPLASPIHQELLMRASHSHIMDIAYKQYTLIWQKHPNDANANLLRGIAAEYLGSDSMYPELHKYYAKIPQATLFPTAAACLEQAVKLAPNSPITNREDGYFLWQYGNNLPKGLSLLKKALQLASNEPRIHTLWGDIYANPGGTQYNLQAAARQLKLSVRIDPTYAFTHYLLASVYSRMGQPEQAKIEEQAYKSLQP